MSDHPGPVIIKIGGSTLESRSTAALWPALVTKLHAEGRGGVVLVHGGGKAVDRQLDRMGFASERREGLRITPDDQIDQVVAILAGSVNKSVVGAINAAGGRAVGLCLGDGRLTRSIVKTGLSFDPGRVGEVAGGDPSLLHALLAAGFLPVISSIGLDEAGRPLNINADDAAAGLAEIARASRLILLTDVPGVMDASGHVVPELTTARCREMIESGEIRGGMIPKVRAAARLAAAGVEVVIISAEVDQLLALIGAGGAVGTRFLPDVPRAR